MIDRFALLSGFLRHTTFVSVREMKNWRHCPCFVLLGVFLVVGCNSRPASIPSPAAEEAKTLNLSNVIGQSGQVLASELSKYRLKESDPTPDDDREIPGGEIRVYDLGNGMELQMSVTRDGKATSVSVSYIEGLGFRIDDASTAMAYFGVTGLGDPETKFPMGWHWRHPLDSVRVREISAETAEHGGNIWQVRIADFVPDPKGRLHEQWVRAGGPVGDPVPVPSARNAEAVNLRPSLRRRVSFCLVALPSTASKYVRQPKTMTRKFLAVRCAYTTWATGWNWLSI
jgi:hypothetical protein